MRPRWDPCDYNIIGQQTTPVLEAKSSLLEHCVSIRKKLTEKLVIHSLFGAMEYLLSDTSMTMTQMTLTLYLIGLMFSKLVNKVS